MCNKVAFVLMPFAEELSDVYKYLITDALSNAGYEVKRADDIVSQNNILKDIVEGIISSDLIVADLTGSNPNVYYELGIAHALDKKVILLTQELEELPFDLRSYRVVSYNIHFAKMNQAKEELRELAEKAHHGNLPFGNPIKDFYATHSRGIESFSSTLTTLESDKDEEYGLLDYRIKLEDGFEAMGSILTDVGTKLADELTPEMDKSGEKLNSGKYTTKQQRNIVRDLATHLQSYGAFLKPTNEKYRALLNDVETSIEFILSSETELEDSAEKELQEFIDVLSVVEEAAFDGRQGFISLIETMDSLPKIEKNFNRAKVFMASELKEFVGNIDQTISVLSRASRLGASLLEKIHSN